MTIISRHRQCVFGTVDHGQFTPSPIGQIADDRWREIPIHFLRVRLDTWQVMPNHIHGILNLCPAMPPHNVSLGAIVGGFKSAVSRAVSAVGLGCFGWQERFLDRILFDDHAIQSMRRYIRDNPGRWRA
ncbi:MAG TPA: hypothetical protein PLC98_24530 [Anaerolineales bacterium]|nr:hypothetical protein [Anaerolineales bacterium]